MPTLKEMADSVATKFNIPTNIFRAQIQQESGWDPSIVGKAGEVGLTQIKPSTAGLDAATLTDPLINLNAGAKYLAQQYTSFGNWSDALAAYNAGPGNKSAGLGYAASVLGAAGVTGSNSPGAQPVPPTNSNPGATPAASGTLSSALVYPVAIGLIFVLVAFGIWGLVKG